MSFIPSRQQVIADIRFLGKIPFTIIIVLIALAAGAATKALWVTAESSDILTRFGYGLPAFKEGHFLNIFTGMLVMPAPWMYALVIPLLALGAGFLEYRYGAIKMLIAVFITHIGAVLLVAGILQLLSTHTSLVWAHDLKNVYDIGISNSAFGVAGAATAALPVIWRRRIRLGLVLYCLTFVIYSSVIWDFTHFAGLLIGLAIGPWVVGRKYELKRQTFSEQSARGYAALFVLFLIFHEVANYISPSQGIIGAAIDDENTSLLVLLGTSMIMAIFAYGLYAGRKIAWRVAVFLGGLTTALLTLAVVLLIINRVFYFQVYFTFVLYAAFFVFLIIFRKAFTVRPNKATRRTIYKRVLVIGALVWIVNAGVIYALRTQFSPVPTLPRAFGESALRIVDFGGDSIEPTTRITRIYLNISGVAWFLFIIGSLAALIFTTYRARSDRESFADYDRLLHEKGSTSIGWMSRWEGMAYWVNPAKTAGFGYRLENNIAIVLSDPVGSKQAVKQSLHAFERSCQINGWKPVFYGVSESMKRMLAREGYQSISVGEDTIIPLKNLEFTGKSWQSIRSSINRAKKDGISMRTVHYNSVSIGMQDQLRTIAKGWSDDKSLPEMGFTLGTLKEAADPEVRMHLAIDTEGTVHGMTSWMPIYRDNKIIGWTIDIMQRRLHEATMPGVIEYLIAESAMDFKQEGYEIISLSAAPLSREGKANGPIERLLDVVAERMEPYYGFKSLYRFKQKFQPRHEPLYLCYKDGAQLPAIAVAIGKAYMPDVSIKDLALSVIK